MRFFLELDVKAELQTPKNHITHFQRKIFENDDNRGQRLQVNFWAHTESDVLKTHKTASHA